jgi:hypothetical protein
MTVSLTKTAFASTAAQSVTLSSVFSVTNDGKNPTYLVVNGLDRDEYTASSTGALGALTGNNATARFTQGNDDGRGLGIVFTWNAATGAYVNATYGNLLNMTMNTSASPNELADLSVYGTNSQNAVTAYGAYLGDAGSMSQLSDTASAPFAYLGTASFATQSVGAPSPATQPIQATPNSICATAMTFIGTTWNIDGCWVLASTIDAEAGAALPVSSSFAAIPGQPSGEWKVAYNGPVSANANWQSLVRAGDQVALITASGSGHITTVVSGAGTSAQLVDNIYYGSNYVNDSTGNDLKIAPAHSVSQEFPGASPANVVIYRLDTPTITVVSATQTVTASASVAFAGLFSVSDWAGTAITAYQAYETTAADSLVVHGIACTTDTSATACATVSSLSALGLLAGTTAGTDTLYLRALNAGGYWGDWTSTALTVSAAKVAAPPTLVAQTPALTVSAGQAVTFSTIGVFRDPTGAALTETATLAAGAALPSWLKFNATTDRFSGTAPITPQTLSLKVTATNPGGQSASEVFSLFIKQPAATSGAGAGRQTILAGLQREWASAATSGDMVRTPSAATTGMLRETVPVMGATADTAGAESQRPVGFWSDLHHASTAPLGHSGLVGLHA